MKHHFGLLLSLGLLPPPPSSFLLLPLVAGFQQRRHMSYAVVSQCKTNMPASIIPMDLTFGTSSEPKSVLDYHPDSHRHHLPFPSEVAVLFSVRPEYLHRLGSNLNYAFGSHPADFAFHHVPLGWFCCCKYSWKWCNKCKSSGRFTYCK